MIQLVKAIARVILLSVLFSPIESIAQDSLSTIYFYRAKQSNSSMKYEVKEGEIQVGRMKPGSVAVYRGKPGLHDFVAIGKTSTTFQMITAPGKEYYVDCIVHSNQPAFRIATRGESRREIAKFDKVVSQKIAPIVITTSPDTVKALQRMFKRKRGWGIGFTVVGTVFMPILIEELINYEPEVVTSSNNMGGIEATTTIDQTPTYVTEIFNSAGAITGGAILWINHTPRKLTTILENKAEGKPFPPKMLRHLKPKDFRAR